MDLAKGTINDAEAAANRVVANVTPQVLTVEDHAKSDAEDLMAKIQGAITAEMLQASSKLDTWIEALGKYKIQINVEIVKK